MVTDQDVRNAKVSYDRLVDKYPQVMALTHWAKFAGQGQRMTPVSDGKGIVDILKVLRMSAFDILQWGRRLDVEREYLRWAITMPLLKREPKYRDEDAMATIFTDNGLQFTDGVVTRGYERIRCFCWELVRKSIPFTRRMYRHYTAQKRGCHDR